MTIDSVPATIEHLPEEVLYTVFRHLDSAELAKCALVVKSWQRAAENALYLDINFIGLDARAIRDLIFHLALSPSKRAAIRSIRISMDTPDFELVWQGILSFPQISRVHVDDCLNPRWTGLSEHPILKLCHKPTLRLCLLYSVHLTRVIDILATCRHLISLTLNDLSLACPRRSFDHQKWCDSLFKRPCCQLERFTAKMKGLVYEGDDLVLWNRFAKWLPAVSSMAVYRACAESLFVENTAEQTPFQANALTNLVCGLLVPTTPPERFLDLERFVKLKTLSLYFYSDAIPWPFTFKGPADLTSIKVVINGQLTDSRMLAGLMLIIADLSDYRLGVEVQLGVDQREEDVLRVRVYHE